MKIVILGAAGFIGTNLTQELLKNKDNIITLVDKSKGFFERFIFCDLERINIVESDFDDSTDFSHILKNQDIVLHLVSTTIPTTSNQNIPQEMAANVVVSAKMFDACVENNIKRVVFISSGGTVYGKETKCPLQEEAPTYPISSYGLQKITIEKLLYLYNHIYGLDYRVVRLANPYGPYQRPNGQLGAVTTFTYKALQNEIITVYGDGSVIRDYIFISDAIRGILNITFKDTRYKTYNLGSGKGTSINELICIIKTTINPKLEVFYKEGRNVDVPINFLNISRYENEFGRCNVTSLCEGIKRTADFLTNNFIF